MTQNEPAICFVHIERAGGTTLHCVFRNNYPLSYCSVTPWYLRPNSRGNELSPEEVRWLFRLLPHTRGFGGHTTRSYLGYEEAARRPIRYVTFVRDPVKRYLSHYNHQRCVKGIDWTIDAFLDDPQFTDFMTERIAGSADVELAKRRLRDDFAFVGLTERFDESLVLMKSQLQLPRFNTMYERENASADPAYQKEVREESEAVLERVRRNNVLDLELYRFVREELFPSYLERFEGDFEAEVARHREQRRDFQFDPVRRAMWMGYRHLLYRHLEWVLHRRHGRPWRQRRSAAARKPATELKHARSMR